MAAYRAMGEGERKHLERLLAWPVDEEERRERWGAGPRAQAAQDAMLSLVSPPSR